MKGLFFLRYLFAKFADFVRESDKILLSLLFLAAGYGCIAVYSATNYMENLRPFLIHTAGLLAGFGVIIVVSLFEYARYLKLWPLFAVLGVAPVLLTFFIGFAPAGTDDKAWLNLGFTEGILFLAAEAGLAPQRQKACPKGTG